MLSNKININKDQFISLIRAPQGLNAATIPMLEKVLEEFPYCQTAHLLYAKNLHLEKQMNYSRQLKIASIYARDREPLYRLIMQSGLQDAINKIETDIEHGLAVSFDPKKHTDTEKKDEKTSSSTVDKQENPPVSKKKEKDIAFLEKEILKEAINSSIALEAKAVESDNKKQAEKPVSTGEIPEVNDTGEKTVQEDITAGTLSFNDWLRKFSKQEPDEKPGETNQKDLIEQFIQENPQIQAPKAEFFSPANMGKLSLVEDDTFVTETLATIYEKQGHLEKALKAFRHLSLKYPEKSVFFADRIKIIEEQLNKKDK